MIPGTSLRALTDRGAGAAPDVLHDDELEARGLAEASSPRHVAAVEDLVVRTAGRSQASMQSLTPLVGRKKP